MYLKHFHPGSGESPWSIMREKWNYKLIRTDDTQPLFFGKADENKQMELAEDPDPADARFTLLDLLAHMKLNGPRKHYAERGLYRRAEGVSSQKAMIRVAWIMGTTLGRSRREVNGWRTRCRPAAWTAWDAGVCIVAGADNNETIELLGSQEMEDEDEVDISRPASRPGA